MDGITFFDCNAYIGLPADRQVQPVLTTEAFVAAMRASRVQRALVWHIAQCEYAPTAGNRMLEEQIAPYEELVGCWAILPDDSWEFPDAEELLRQMKASRIAALRAFPTAYQFFLNRLYCGKLLEAISERKIPLLISLRRGADYGTVCALLEAYPKLVCILCDQSEWALDRYVPALLAKYSDVYIDTTFFGLHGMIETLSNRFGAHRILFGSGFPEVGFGPMVYEIEHAELSDADRIAIASGNLQRILQEARL